MREYKCSFYGDIVDLDNPKTYDYLSKDIKILREKLYKEFGQAFCYMDGFHPDIFVKTINKQSNRLLIAGYNQRLRVNKLLKKFIKGFYKHYNDVLWYQEQIFLLQDECENMC